MLRRGTTGDVLYYVPGRKRPVTSSTKATSDFLAVVHEQNPEATIAQLRDIITDSRKFIFSPEAAAVLNSHIAAGYGSDIPNWK